MYCFQVALPGLHISLGVFHKFFKMLEDECSVLDIKIAEKLAENKEGAGNENFPSFIESVKKMSHVQTSMAKLNDELQFLNDAIHVQLQGKVLLFKHFCFSKNQIS